MLARAYNAWLRCLLLSMLTASFLGCNTGGSSLLDAGGDEFLDAAPGSSDGGREPTFGDGGPNNRDGGRPGIDAGLDGGADPADAGDGGPDEMIDEDAGIDELPVDDGCPADPAKAEPGVCGCGVSDTDHDADGTADCDDECDDDDAKTVAGVCGCGVADTNGDGDAELDCNDGCPGDGSKTAAGQCGCGNADVHSDADTVADCVDACPTDANKTAVGICGCGVAESSADTDTDGVEDCVDGCPNDIAKIAEGVCGCGTADVHSDADGVADCLDECAADPDKIAAGQCGCGAADTDGDGDDVADCVDECPADEHKSEDGECGCGVADTDTDEDGTADCNDACPDDQMKAAAGFCGCGASEASWTPAAFAWTDITAGGTRLTQLDIRDDASVAIGFGFDLPFFGDSYSTAVVSTNGFLMMGAASASNDYTNDAIPNANPPNGVAALLWDDLEVDASASVWGAVQGTSPNRRLIVSWNNVRFLGTSDRISAQMWIDEADGAMQYQYWSASTVNDLTRGDGASIGVESPSGTEGIPYSINAASLTYPSAIRLDCDSGGGG